LYVVAYCFIEIPVISTEICFNGSMFYYELLHILEFTSDRKRMSVVVKERHTGKILLLSKGADESILPRSYPGTCSSNDKCITLIGQC
jgi:magnesium-transporting ATPase (P-type)